MNKTVYVPMAVDLIHKGHINIIKIASSYGKVIVGLLTDEAVAAYKRVPYLDYEQRKLIVQNIVGVDEVVKQEEDDYIPTIMKLKPDYFVHGDDWKEGVQKNKRKRVIKVMKELGGEVIEPAYTKEVSSTILNDYVRSVGTTADIRRQRLRYLLKNKDIVRILEAHNGLTGLIVEKTKIGYNEFDGMWLSSLTHSASKGKPDSQYVDITTVSQTLGEIFDVTTKPMIVDLDNGGLVEHFKPTIRTLERQGVSAVIIEDKIGNKRNSLFEDTSNQNQDTIEDFSYKISEGKKSLVTKDFMIIARIESLILKAGMTDAVERAKAYIDSGVDGIMIHSKDSVPDEILEFCDIYQQFETKVPLVAVPSTYCQITENQLFQRGVNLVIYANHLMRSAYPAMVKTAKQILLDGSSYQASEEYCMPIQKIISLIPEGN
jgi:phosphoenolpyruvate mutase